MNHPLSFNPLKLKASKDYNGYVFIHTRSLKDLIAEVVKLIITSFHRLSDKLELSLTPRVYRK